MAVICKRCKRVLDDTITGETEYKMCTQCVLKTTPMADRERVQKMRDQVPLMRANGHNQELQRLAEKLKSITVEFQFEEIEGEPKLVFHIKDYFKKDFFVFALGEQHLEDFLHDIRLLKEEK